MTQKHTTPEHELLDAYKKDADEEQFLEWFNGILAPYEQPLYKQLDGTLHATYYVIGVPRSGTTLANQLLAHVLGVGYVNHLIASMWQAPVMGVHLSQKLLPDAEEIQFQSKFGSTNRITEPHEFGYFWSERLGYQNLMQPSPSEIENVNWTELRKVIQNMSYASGKPFLFKPLMLVWYLDELIKHCPESRFLWIDRDPLQVALSLLHMREEMTGSQTNWLSLKPSDYNSLKQCTPYEQVAGQIAHIHSALEHAWQKHRDRHIARVSYEDFCTAPQAAVDKFLTLNPGHGTAAKQIRECPPEFKIHKRSIDHTSALQTLEYALEKAFEHTSETNS